MTIRNPDIGNKAENKEKAEFEALFKKYYKSLCIMAYEIVKDMDTAEEIVQDFFYNYWKNRKSIKIKTSIKAYLYKSIYNSSLNHLRALSVRQKHAENTKHQHEYLSQNKTLQDIEAKELRVIIDKTLSELPQRYANIFYMSRFEGLKYKEIADTLSISVKTVEAAMGKVLAVFRKKLGNYIDLKQ